MTIILPIVVAALTPVTTVVAAFRAVVSPVVAAVLAIFPTIVAALRLGQQGNGRGGQGDSDNSGLGEAVHLRAPFWAADGNDELAR